VSAAEKLDFKIGDDQILIWDDGSRRPATAQECQMWRLLHPAAPAPLVVDSRALVDELQCHWPDWDNVGSTSMPCACGAQFEGVTWPAFYRHLVAALLSSGVVVERGSEYGLMFRSHYDQDSWTPKATVMPREKAEQLAAASSGFTHPIVVVRKAAIPASAWEAVGGGSRG
jgi:hypothetical protein